MAESSLRPGARLYDRLERAIDPVGEEEATALAGLDAYAETILTPAVSDALEASGAFPAQELSALLRGPVGAALTPVAQGGTMRWPTVLRVCGRLAAHDLGVTLCLGGVVLASLPLIVAGNEAQRVQFFADVRKGHVAGLGLSEWERGSDLLANDTIAIPINEAGESCNLAEATHFRLRGEKRPINNSSRGRNLVVLARTGEADDPFGSTLFLLTRGLPGLGSSGPVDWAGYAGLDLNGIVLEDVVVPRAASLGKVGEGFVHTRATLAITRSGVAGMSVGANAAVFEQAWAHARSRRLYGETIDALGGVRRLLAHAFSRLCLATAMCRQAAHAASWDAHAARPFTCATKYLCPVLLEDNVRDCGTILSARSFMREQLFTRLRRDSPVFAIFDGSSLLQLDELWRAVARWPSSETVSDPRGSWRQLVEVAPTDLGGNGRGDLVAACAPTIILPVLADSDFPELGPYGRAAGALQSAAQGARAWPQARRFALSESAASLIGIAALAQACARASGSASVALRAALRLTLVERSAALARSVCELCQGQEEAAVLSGEVLASGMAESDRVEEVFESASLLLS